MNIKKIIKYVLIAVPLLFLAKWGIESVVYDSNKTPEINQNPTHKMRIHGKFPFGDTVKADMEALYITTNPKCDTNNWIAGIIFPQRFKKSFPATIKDGIFESDIYLDSYLPGMCEWQAHSISIKPQRKKDDATSSNKDMVTNEEQASKELYISTGYIGVISYDSFKKYGELLDVECFRRNKVFSKGTSQEVSLTRISCDYTGEISRPRDRGSKLKANISSLQKEVEINFIDKGWKE